MNDGAGEKRGEFDLIHRYFAPLAEKYPNAFNLTDDAALVDHPAHQSLVVTTDAMVAGVHFFDHDSAHSVAQKLLRVNLSDLAAMGAAPHAYTLVLALPKNFDEQWVAEFSAGLAEDQSAFDVVLIGGDTVSTPGPLTLSLTALGFVDAGHYLRRNGAKEGDTIWVSGVIGDAALALQSIKDKAPVEALMRRLQLPDPRISLGQGLSEIATSATDISDGLIADLGHICRASHVGAKIQFANIPLSSTTATLIAGNPVLYETILTGGEDYELVFTAGADMDNKIFSAGEVAETPVSKIGVIEKGKSIRVFDSNGAEINLSGSGFSHF